MSCITARVSAGTLFVDDRDIANNTGAFDVNIDIQGALIRHDRRIVNTQAALRPPSHAYRSRASYCAIRARSDSIASWAASMTFPALASSPASRRCRPVSSLVVGLA